LRIGGFEGIRCRIDGVGVGKFGIQGVGIRRSGLGGNIVGILGIGAVGIRGGKA
jgi:hypothetical protein